ncbi:hypothetical protein [Ruegeria jejuensis]|uniref:hypothetical protein n=1 Tax=Ruegeria jejuensis TaxID=3233338 RepID=UPI00355B487E
MPFDRTQIARTRTAPLCDRTEDITDNWIEETDKENVENEGCTGYFDETETGLLLVGVEVESGSLTNFYPREIAMRFLTPETVDRIEDHFTAVDEGI